MKNLFTSRAFWCAMIGLIVVVVAAFVPTFDLEADTAAGLAVVIVSYILGVTVDPGPGGWRGVIQSRKFWAAAIGLSVLVLDGFGLVLPFGLTTEQMILFVLTIAGLIAGPAVEARLKPQG